VRPEHAPTLERYLHLGRQLFAEQFLPHSGETSEIPEFRRFDCRFLVLCSSRSGSELLCYLLRDFGAATTESMSFLPDVGADLQRRGVSTLREALVSLCHRAPAAVFSAKGTGMIMPPLLIYDELPAHRDEWRFVILQRRDVLAQAVSLAIAEQTGVWRSDGSASRVPRLEDYDSSRILQCLDAIAQVNAHIARLESGLGVRTLRVDYEDLAAEPRAVSDRVGAFHGLTRQGERALRGEDRSIAPPHTQRSAINGAWAERFRREEFDIRPAPP
jgi:LPS sulfotransferase NodH